LNLNGWIPFRVYWAPRGEGDPRQTPMADWCRFDDIRFTEPFFERTMQRAMRHPFRVLFRHQTTLDVLEQRAATNPGIRPSGFIFHMSRCGSTLVSGMLATSAANVVISEAWPVDSVVTADLGHPEVSDDQRMRWLRGIISALGQPRGGAEHRCFVKFDCWHALDMPLIRRAFPDVPWVFIYRDPVEVLVSQLKAPAAWTIPGLMPVRAKDSPHVGGLPVLPDEYAAHTLNSICESALLALDATGLLLNYTELPGAVFTRLADHFNCTFSDEEAAAMRETARFDAKNPGFWFAPDAADKQRQATIRARDLSDRWLSDVYRRLKAYSAFYKNGCQEKKLP
jgi:hypothetical protein